MNVAVRSNDVDSKKTEEGKEVVAIEIFPICTDLTKVVLYCSCHKPVAGVK